jgi:fluoride ion exporter CrcB/FEX
MGRLIAVYDNGDLESIVGYSIVVCAEKATPVNFPLGTLTADLLGFLLMGFLLCHFIIR